ncbi:LPS export ABC transporter periplasmic protein LptC [soil metagenome]
MNKIIFAVLLIASAFLVYSCDSKFEPPRINTGNDSAPTQESWNSEVTFSDSGNVKAVLKAGHISAYSTKAYYLIDSGAKVDFYKQGKQVSTLTGRRGKVNDITKDIEIYDSVTVVNNEGVSLSTEKLLWKDKSQKVSSDVFVRIITKTERIEGIGFESDQNLKNYVIYKVTGTFAK